MRSKYPCKMTVLKDKDYTDYHLFIGFFSKGWWGYNRVPLERMRIKYYA